ncbi:MAG: hypothetical protein AB7P21_12660 [Lautropia sp.]
MVAQVKAVTRAVADQAVAAGAQLVDITPLADAVVVDAAATAQAPDAASRPTRAVDDDVKVDAVADADTVTTTAVAPTAAPIGASIGELAQATSDSKTDSAATPAPADAGAAAPAATDAAAATTPAPAAEAAAEGGGLSGWAIGGLALLGIGAAVAIGNNSSSDDSPPAAAQPPAAPPPASPPPASPPPAPAPSTVPTGFVEASGAPAGTKIYFKDADADNTLDAGERTILFNTANNHYYELVDTGAPITFENAATAAATRGGHLFAGADATEVGFVQTAYGYPAAGTPPVYGGLEVNNTDANNGAWVGLTDTAAGANAWTWVTSTGATTGGQALSSTDALWIVRGAGDAEPTGFAGETYGAMTGGNPLTTAPGAATQVLYDTDNNGTISKYVVEYETLASIKDPSGNPLAIDGNSLFGSQGAGDAAVAVTTPATGISHLIDDPSMQA